MKLLDLFCGAGGAGVGYHRVGFGEIVGVDPAPQPRYPFQFVRADALEYLASHGHDFDAIHASPPCQGYSIMHNLPWLRDREYPHLLKPVLEMLEGLGKPYVVENVMGARIGSLMLKKRGLGDHGLDASWLCGTMFGLPFYRHRLFAANWLWLAPGHPKHTITQERVTIPTRSGNFDPNYRKKHDGKLNIRPGYEKVPFSFPTIRIRKNGRTGEKKISPHHSGMGNGVGHAVGWKLAAEAMGIDWMKRDELTQAIPPAYTEHVGRQLIAVCDA